MPRGTVSMKRDDMKKILLGMLDEYMDPVLKEERFTRRNNSLIYARKIGTTRQKIIMYFSSNPSYYPGAMMHIHPHFRISFPEINEKAREMTENMDYFVRNEKLTINQPIQLCHKDVHEYWVMMDIGNREMLAQKIMDFLKKYTFPLLDELKCGDDLIRCYEKRDERIMISEQQYIYVASAYVLKGEYEKALDALEMRFKAAGHRKYASVFHYIEDLL